MKIAPFLFGEILIVICKCSAHFFVVKLLIRKEKCVTNINQDILIK